MTKVSVVIPAFNSEKHIANTLDSVLVQSYADYEVILIDDGSTDKTVSIVNQYMIDYPGKIRLFQKVNEGPGSARNIGIRKAVGEYIAFIDADDLWLPDKLEKQVAYFENRPSAVGLVYTRSKKFDDHGIWERHSKYNRTPVRGRIYHDILRDNMIPNLSVMVRKKCFDDVGVFDESLGLIEDHDMWLRIAEKYDIDYLDEVLCLHREHEGGRSKLYDTTIKRNIGVYRKHLNMAKGDVHLQDTIKLCMSQKYYDLGYCYVKSEKMAPAREAFRKSLELEFRIKTSLMIVAAYFPFKFLDLLNKLIKAIVKPSVTVKSKQDLQKIINEIDKVKLKLSH